MLLADVGWVWVPGDEWAPAWVSWRITNDKKYVGWAPLTPEVRVKKGTPVKGWVDSAYDIGPDYYSFIETKDFGADSYRGKTLPLERTTTIITETTNVTTIRYETVDKRETVYCGGPEVQVITEYSGRPVRELRLEARVEDPDVYVRTESRGFTRVNGGVLTVLTAPRTVITASTFARRPERLRERVTDVRVDRGYSALRDPQTIERIRANFRSGPPAPPEIQRQADTDLRRIRSVTPLGRPDGAPGAAATAPGGAPPPPPAAPGATPPAAPGGRPGDAPPSPAAADRRPGAEPANSAAPTPAGRQIRGKNDEKPGATGSESPADDKKDKGRNIRGKEKADKDQSPANRKNADGSSDRPAAIPRMPSRKSPTRNRRATATSARRRSPIRTTRRNPPRAETMKRRRRSRNPTTRKSLRPAAMTKKRRRRNPARMKRKSLRPVAATTSQPVTMRPRRRKKSRRPVVSAGRTRTRRIVSRPPKTLTARNRKRRAAAPNARLRRMPRLRLRRRKTPGQTRPVAATTCHKAAAVRRLPAVAVPTPRPHRPAAPRLHRGLQHRILPLAAARLPRRPRQLRPLPLRRDRGLELTSRQRRCD